MDIKDYISSGAIESYVLGLAAPDEMQELENLSALHPEVKKALRDFEEALEKSILSNVEPVPSFLKARIMATLEEEGMMGGVSHPMVNVTDATINTTPAKVIPITFAPKGIMWLRGAIAACIILLIGSSIINFYFYSQYRHYVNQYKELLAQNTIQVAKANMFEASYDMVKNPAMKMVPMNTAPTKSGSFLATIYWDTNSKDVYLMVNKLPQTPVDKQYQLWAIVDGKPVDAGMVDMAKADGLIKMKNMPSAQAFAITLEKKGGSATPTMDEMYVLGKT